MDHEESRDSLGFLSKNHESNDNSKHLISRDTKK